MGQPNRYTIINPATLRVEHIYDYRGTQNLALRPLLLECDFCCRSSDRLWRRQVRGFGVEMWPKRYMVFDGGGRWNACVFCNPLVESRDLKGLVARVVTINEDARGCPAAGFERLYAAVFAATEDDLVEIWQAGEVFEARDR